MNINQPLRPWLWCCFWLILIWSGLFYAHTVLSPYYDQNRRIYQHDFDQHSDVIILGDSLVKYSFSSLKNIHLNNQDISLTVLPIGSSNWIEFAPFLPKFQQTNSQLIIVQDSLLLIKDKTFFTTLLYGYLKAQFFNTNNKVEQIIPIKPSKIQLMDRKKAINKIYSNNAIVSREAIQFIRLLSRSTKRLIVVHLPRSRLYADSQEEKNWLHTLEKQLNDLGIQLYIMGKPLDDNYYFDGAHTNKKGAEVRYRQLNVLLEKHLP